MNSPTLTAAACEASRCKFLVSQLLRLAETNDAANTLVAFLLARTADDR